MSRRFWVPGTILLVLILALGGSVVWSSGAGATGTYALLTGGVYTLMGLGFLLIMAWAYSRGQFDDLERAKYRMLELEEER